MTAKRTLTPKFDVVIFDIDNVLVDTRASYTDCIRRTVQTYLEKNLRFKPFSGSILSRHDVEQFKSLGGFNDDWDTSYGLLLYLLSCSKKNRSISHLKHKVNIASLGRQIKTRPFKVRGAERRFGKNRLVTIRKIARTFQRFYFKDFVRNEKLMISRSFLKELNRRGIRLGVLTGRNQREASMAMKRFKISSAIDAMITTNQTPKKYKKPHPYGLVKLAKRLGTRLRYLYVGDLPDDVLAVKRARRKIKISSCGYLAAANQPAAMRRQLRRVGVNFICFGVNDLRRVIF